MSDLLVKSESLIGVANKIRSQTGSQNEISFPNGFESEIETLVQNVTSDATASNNDILAGKSAYANGIKIIGNILTKTATDVTENEGVVTIPFGYYASTITKNIEKVKLASVLNVKSYDIPEAWASYGIDFIVEYYNGYYSPIDLSLEIYKDEELLGIESQHFNNYIRNTHDNYKYRETIPIGLRDINARVRGMHAYKVRVIGNGFIPSDFSSSFYFTCMAYKPTINLSSSIMSISSSDPLTDSYKIYADNTLKTTISKTLDITTYDLSNLNLSSGSHTIKVKAVGTDIVDSNFSNELTYVVSSGYTITTTLNVEVYTMMSAYIKINEPPTSNSDFSYYYQGSIGSYDTDIPASFLASKIYIWGNFGVVTSPIAANLSSHSTYDTALEINFSSNSTLGLTLYMDE